MNDNHQLMENENITKLLVKFSIPAIVGMLVNALYNVVDRYYIGNIENIGDLAIAGLGLTFPIMILIFSFAVLIGLGGATNTSLLLGEKKKDEAERVLGNSIFISSVISIMLTIVTLFYLDDIVNLLGGSEAVRGYSKEYLRILAYGFPTVIIGYAANVSIRSDGNPKLAMVTVLLGAGTNIVLDPILIFGFDMGVKGAGIATVISEYISGLWAVYYFISKHSGIKLRLKNMKFSLERTIKTFSLGSAPFAVQLGASAVNYIYNFTLNQYGGDSAVGAMTIVQGIVMFVTMPLMGINQGLQPILGYNYGAKLYKRVREALYKGVGIATVFCIVDFLVIQLFSKYFIIFFAKKEELIRIAAHGLRIQTMMLPVVGIIIITSVYFQAVGKPKLSLFMSLSRQVIVLIPCIIILSKKFGVSGVWYAGPTADFISCILTITMIKGELKFLNQRIKNEEDKKIEEVEF